MRTRRGFTLLEIMVALALLATVFVLVMQAQRQAIAQAADARSQSIAARLGAQFLHRVEAGMVPDLHDGYSGDFSEEGYGSFTYVVGLGDGSRFASGPLDESEAAWREFKRRIEEEADEDEVLPPETRVFLTISYPAFGPSEEPRTYAIETLVDSWAIHQDFRLYEALWPDLLPEAIE